MKTSGIGLSLALIAISVSAQADIFGSPSGRSANPANNPDLSIEGSFNTSGDYQNIGARVNYQATDVLTVYGDFGLSEFNNFGADVDGNAFGLGIFYYLPDLSDSMQALNTMDVAVQASFHSAALELNSDFDVDYSVLAAALLVSPKEAFNPDNGMNWYANFGLSRIATDVSFRNTGLNFGGSNSDIELQIGAGVYLPGVGPGTAYAGIDFIDEIIFGIGYRYGFQ